MSEATRGLPLLVSAREREGGGGGKFRRNQPGSEITGKIYGVPGCGGGENNVRVTPLICALDHSNVVRKHQQ